MDTKILLENGTNELEILEFIVDGNSYGINVAKIKEIIRCRGCIGINFYPVFLSLTGSMPARSNGRNLPEQMEKIINWNGSFSSQPLFTGCGELSSNSGRAI